MPQKEEYNSESYNAVLSRIETKLDVISEEMKAEKAELREYKKNIYQRISTLENFKYYLMGVVGLASLIGSSIISWFREK